MSESKARKSATAKFIEQHPLCALCGGTRPSATREHIPPTALFDRSQRPNGIVVPSCDECNRGTSTADLVTSIMSRWRYTTNPTEDSDHSRLILRLRHQAPEVIDELTSIKGGVQQKKARRHLESQGVHVPDEFRAVSIGPKSISYLNQFSLKLALGLHYSNVGSIITRNGRASAFWRTKEDVQKQGLPNELLARLPNVASIFQGKWSTRETFEYRYAINPGDGVFAFVARFRAALFIYGFTIADAKDELLSEEWLPPTALLEIPNQRHFAKRI